MNSSESSTTVSSTTVDPSRSRDLAFQEASSGSTAAERPAVGMRQGPVWLFSRNVDLAAFGGSALVSLFLLAVGWKQGWLNADTPDWTWVSAILLVDVAHVYATGFRVYFVPGEFSKRPWVYGLAPALGFFIGWAVFSESETFFWRALAYLAVFHFVRQQYGWVSLYRSRAGEIGMFGRVIDTAAIYLATVYPLIFWHAHMPRNFWWFLPGDFTQAPLWMARIAEPLYWTAMIAYATRSLVRGIRLEMWNPGKDLVLVTTAVCWYAGIVATNSDYGFTVTNVIIHGVPYFVLVYWYRFVRGAEGKREKGEGKRDDRTRDSRELSGALRRHFPKVVMFLATLWFLAYVEELVWDRGIWQERSWLFGGEWNLGGWRNLVVPLLAVPQLTHYILDGFIWRRRSNPELRSIAERD